MKKSKIIILGIFLIIGCTLQAQVTLSINIGVPPQWGPSGYTDVRYYYLPDVEAYYDIQTSMFIYQGIGGWVHRSGLPTRYHNYDLYSGYKVVMSDYHGSTPYTHFKDHKSKYAKGYHGQAQQSIGHRSERDNSKVHKSEKSRSSGNQNQGHNNNNKKQNNENRGGKNNKRK